MNLVRAVEAPVIETPEPLKLTPDQLDKVAKLQSYGHSEDEAIEFVKDGFVPDTFNPIAALDFKKLFDDPTQMSDELVERFHQLSPEAQQAFAKAHPGDYNWMTNTFAWDEYQKGKFASMGVLTLHEPQTQTTMDQHWNDLQSIFEDYTFPGESFVNWNKNNPDLTPEELHNLAIGQLKKSGYHEAAQDVQQLWDTKVAEFALVNDVPKPPLIPTGFLWTPEEQAGKFDVFNYKTGQNLQTFDTEAEAFQFMESHPDNQLLDVGPAQKLPSALPEGFEGFDDVSAPTQSNVWTPEELADFESNVTAKFADQGYKLKVDNATDVLGGQNYNKQIYTRNGQDYLFKQTNPPWVAEQEVSAATIANLAGLHPTEIKTETVNGKTGSMQAAIGNNFNWPTLKEVDLTTLTAEELRDVIKNHPVDWLTANHDAHGANFLRTPNGIVEVDRGRAFKNYGQDKLDPDYNPTGGPGFYN